MEVYVFVYQIKPTKGSPEFTKVASATAEIWVYEKSRDVAETKALSHLLDFAWEVIEVEDEIVMHDEQIQHYRIEAQLDFQKAKSLGFHSNFYGCRHEDSEEDSVEIRPLSSPFNRSNNTH